MKFGRIYNLTVQISDHESVVISYPLTIRFNIARGVLSSANTGVFRIYNLAPKTRAQIYHDRYDTLTYRQIRMQAGYEYETKLPLIFQGNILSAYSFREGTDWVTEIEAFDGGFGIITGNISEPVPSGYDLKNVLLQVIRTMAPTVTAGAVGNVSTDNSRGLILMGSSWDVITNLAGDASGFIDNEKAHILKDNEYLDDIGLLPLINAETGLLGTPRRYDARLDINVLFEPRVGVGQKIDLESSEKVYNGTYKVLGVTHRATISGSIGGDAVTTLSLWKGPSLIGVKP